MSTVHAALELTESISNSIDSKQHCAGVFIDLKKAFDTVNHKLLVGQLSCYWVRLVANAWLENYLMNRKQYVFYFTIRHSACNLSNVVYLKVLSWDQFYSSCL